MTLCHEQQSATAAMRFPNACDVTIRGPESGQCRGVVTQAVCEFS
ncbi:hypothetical protein HMPREF9607_01560 [Cutibacterium modestum HL044PA1]|uniref:DUF1540 domain-containing protein n=1 Tax=Cutibacterium modestum HL044PA1 TaxID=765109 RepID=A0ABP2K5L5_9ACTN|nr:hypothetical protein HMPREF9607_01560 [Cutibacterium modestum HL044PA1]